MDDAGQIIFIPRRQRQGRLRCIDAVALGDANVIKLLLRKKRLQLGQAARELRRRAREVGLAETRVLSV